MATSEGTFVRCRYPRTIIDSTPVAAGETPNSFHMKADFIGVVPDWVLDHWYFKALLKDGTISVVAQTATTAIETAESEAAALERQAKLVQEMNVKIEEAREAARFEAEAEAAEQGLDQASRKKLIKSKQDAASAAVKKEYNQ